MSLKSLLAGLWLFPVILNAQLPSEILLVVNQSSTEATRIAHQYVRQRGIPDERILYLNPPASFFRQSDASPRWTVREDAMREHLLEPVLKKVKALNDPSPAAVLLTPDWPTRVRISDVPDLSTTGFISLRGEVPDGELIKTGRAASPWFVPPPDTPQNARRRLRYPTPEGLPPDFPLPVAMLGAFYPPLTPDRVMEILDRAMASDHSQPEGTVVFETANDVRTRTRLSQYEAAKERLESSGVSAVFLTAEDPVPERVIGVMGGAATIRTGRYADSLIPGAFADHLTSFAGTFDNRHQTKLTEWLDAGASTSAGTVTEPYSVWTKFPEAALFERYLRGLTLWEAYMQSMASPYQTLLVGDPLSRPWARALADLDLETEWDGNQLTVRAVGAPSGASTHLHLFADGRRISGPGPVWTLQRSAEDTGPELDLILHARYQWAPPRTGFARKRIDTPYPEKLTMSARRRGDTVRLDLRSDEQLIHWEIFQGHRRLHSGSTEGRRHRLELPAARIGTGPLTLQARGVTPEGTLLRSNLLDLDFKSAFE